MKKLVVCPNVSLEYLQATHKQKQTVFHCCGVVLIKSDNLRPCPFNKRHGMSGKGLNIPKYIENASEAYEYDYSNQKIIKPAVPFSGNIPSKLFNGITIQIEGQVHESAERFAINLVTDKKNGCDIAFHFNPRFDRRVIVRNTRTKGYWGEEEIACCRPFPFKVGRNVKVTILVADGQFMVAVNNKYYCNYSYRIPLHQISTLAVDGDITLAEIIYCETLKFPTFPPSRSPRIMLPSDNGYAKIRKHTQGIVVGTKVIIQGQVKLLPYEFYINLQIGSTLVPHPIIPLHINLRLCRPGLLEQQIICNSWINGGWESEIKPPSCPFLPGMNFELSIYYLDEGFTVFVNDNFLVLFPLRLPYPPGIDTILAEGDVKIFSVVTKKIPKEYLL